MGDRHVEQRCQRAVADSPSPQSHAVRQRGASRFCRRDHLEPTCRRRMGRALRDFILTAQRATSPCIRSTLAGWRRSVRRPLNGICGPWRKAPAALRFLNTNAPQDSVSASSRKTAPTTCSGRRIACGPERRTTIPHHGSHAHRGRRGPRAGRVCFVSPRKRGRRSASAPRCADWRANPIARFDDARRRGAGAAWLIPRGHGRRRDRIARRRLRSRPTRSRSRSWPSMRPARCAHGSDSATRSTPLAHRLPAGRFSDRTSRLRRTISDSRRGCRRERDARERLHRGGCPEVHRRSGTWRPVDRGARGRPLS